MTVQNALKLCLAMGSLSYVACVDGKTPDCSLADSGCLALPDGGGTGTTDDDAASTDGGAPQDAGKPSDAGSKEASSEAAVGD